MRPDPVQSWSGLADLAGTWRSTLDSAAILDAIDHSIALVDTSGVIQFANLGWRRFGWENRKNPASPDADIGIGANYLAVCANAAARAVQGATSAHQGLRAVLQGQLPCFRQDYPCHSPSTLRWFRMSVMPIGRPVQGALIAHHDITEQKRGFDRLRLAQAVTGMGTFDLDLASGLVSWDMTMRRMWGYPATPTVSLETLIAGIHADDQADFRSALERALDPARGGELCLEFRAAGSGTASEDSHLLCHARVHFHEQCAQCLFGVVHDISARRQLDTRLKQRRAQIDALACREIASQTVSAIANALNQPLAALSAYSDAALQMLRNGAPSRDALERTLSSVVSQASRAGQVLHRLQDALHCSEVPIGPVAVRELLTDTLWLASDGGHAEFNLALETEDREQWVLADPTQLQTILLGLLRNSLESMRLAGMLESNMRVVIRARDGGGKMHITISDNGPGLASEIAHRIFDPFFSTKDGSVGLGLSIGRALMEAQGEKLWLESGSPHGTTFHLTLPLAP